MHLPDAILDVKTALLSTGAAAVGMSIALRQVRTSLQPRQMPLLGLAAAFVLAAQMLNFPILGGTSGHLIGGVLTAILLGPSAAIIVISCVLIVQCLMFSDGGLLALGANVFNMAIVNVCGGYFVFRLVKKGIRMDETRSTVFAAAFAAWCGTVLASISCAGQIALSKTVSWGVVFPAMANVHMLIGLGEGLATALIVIAILHRRSELLTGLQESGPRARPGLVAYGLLLAFGLVIFVAPFACSWPDGLDSVATALGFEPHPAAGNPVAPFPEYRLPFIGSVTVATALAGVLGTLVAFLAAYMLARLLVPVMGHSKKNAPTPN
jgi:cobalt/nickel transport system permease protein